MPEENKGKESVIDKIEDKIGHKKHEGGNQGSEHKQQGHEHKKEGEFQKFENYERKEEQKEAGDKIWGQDG